MRYWWVNHKQTLRQEIEGAYLWSPKRTKNNRRNQFYENMCEAQPGDVVLSFANAQIGYVGRVSASAFEAPKPNDYGPAGENWNSLGWRLPVAWTRLARPVRPKEIIADLRPWLPKKYSPIRAKTGNGNQGAYLAEIRKSVFEFVIEQGGGDPREWQAHIGRSPRTGTERSDRVNENRTPYDAPIEDSEGEQTIKVRRGQGLFRVRVSKVEKKGCRVTGIRNPRLLRASHIKPWRSCTTYERLDGANGLLLTPDVDHLFDNGYISFEDSGDVLVSSKLSSDELRRLGLTDPCSRNAGAFSERQKAYLSHHRRHVFKP